MFEKAKIEIYELDINVITTSYDYYNQDDPDDMGIIKR